MQHLEQQLIAKRWCCPQQEKRAKGEEKYIIS